MEVQMLKSIRNLDYVVLLCDDLSLMKSFYHDIMGFPIYLEMDSWIEMRVGSVLLALSKRDRPHVGPALPDESAAVQLAFRVAVQEVQSCYEELKVKNVEIVQPPQTIDKRVWKYWKHRTLFFKDPEGNLLEIYADIDIPDET
jgi:lactoylglutathione lyase